MKISHRVFLFIVCTVCLPLAAAPIRVGFAENGGVDVPEGTTLTQDGAVVVENEGTFNKVGKGTYALDQANLDQTHRTALNVLDGTLALTAGQAASAAVAPAFLATKATLWITPESVVTNASGGVTDWRDIRDVQNETALYCRFKPQWSTANAGYDFSSQNPELLTTNGVTSVFFGGRYSNKFMRLYTANGATETETPQIWHAYVVHGCFSCFGYVIGSHSRRTSFVSCMSASLPALSDAKIFYNRGDLHRRHQNARVRLNGDIVSPFATRPLEGFQLLSFDHTDFAGYYSTLMYNDFEVHTGGQGGDCIAEVILIGTRLTEAERVEVERYLLAKYGLNALDAKTPMGHQGYGATVNLTVAPAATVEVTAASGVTSAPVALSGNGTVVKKGEGCLAIGPSDDAKPSFGGTFDFQAGSVFLRGGQLPPVVAKGGRKLTVAAENNGGDTLKKQASSGIRGTMADQANATAFEKDGVGEARVNKVAADVRRLNVTAGTLVLEAPALTGGVVTNGGAICATIPNADFELPVSKLGANGRYQLYTHLANGWIAGDTYGSAYLTLTNSWGTWSANSAKPHSGSQALLLVQANSARTTMTVPMAGYYEFSLWTHSRHAIWNSAHAENAGNAGYSRTLLKLQLGKSESALQTFGYAQAGGDCEFIPTRVITPYLEAGDYCLRLAGADGGNDAAVLVDDVSCRFLSEERPQAAYKIPNGDFELWTRSTLPYSFPYVTWRQLLSGWTWGFWDASSASETQGTNSLVGVVCAGTPFLRGNTSCDNPMPFAERFTGAGMLFLHANQNAHATTTFTPPAGRYFLRAKVWQRRTAVMVGASSSDELNLYGNDEADVCASITRSDASVVNLGKVATKEGQVGRTAVWGQEVSFDGTESVTLTVWASSANSCIGVLVDELELMDATKPCDFGELITDGSFENINNFNNNNGKWGAVNANPFYAHGYIGCFGPTGSDFWAFGHQIYEGRRFLRFQEARMATQNVTIPQAGLYRLTFRSMSRPNNLAGNGRNPISAFFVDTSVTPPVTNKVCRVIPECANFIEHSYLVKFDAAKTYKFYIGGTGLNPTAQYEDRVASLDGVSLRRVTEERAAAPEVPKDMILRVEGGANLFLNYTGTVSCAGVKYAGRTYHGILTAATNPEFISGPGTIDAGTSRGLMILFR